MAAPAAASEFVELLRKSNILDPKAIDEFLGRQPGYSSSEVKALADRMIEGGLLTGFQAKQLLAGKYRGFDLGKYQLLDKIGSGGMGQVFLARHTVMRRPVAIKILPPKQAQDPKSLERFHREARAAGALTHPNIVRAYDVDSAGGMHFIVMEFVDGCSLQELVVTRGPLSPDRAAYYLWQAAVGLQHAHQSGLVHRDIKPANLLLDRDGVVKLLDLGLARFFHDADDSLTRDESNNKGILGTADYLAPEQALDSHEVDVRGDIYSLGATGYFLLTGKVPFPDLNTTQKLLAHQIKEPTAIESIRGDVPAELLAILRRMMAKNPADRYQSPAEVMAALAPWADHPPPPPTEDELPRRHKAVGASPSSIGSTSASTAGMRAVTLAGRRSAKETPSGGTPAPARKVSPGLLAGAGIGLFAVGGIIFWLTRGGTPPIEPAKPVIAATPTAPVTPAPAPVATVAKAVPAPRPTTTGTFIVGPDGTHPSLAAALAAATPGTTILVREAGVTGRVTLGPELKGITLIGEGSVRWTPAADQSAASPLVTLRDAPGVTIRGFQLDGDGRVDSLVELTGGCSGVTIERCDFSRFRKHGLRLTATDQPDSAPLRIVQSRLHDGEAGVEAVVRLNEKNRGVVISDCRIEGPGAAGVHIGPVDGLVIEGTRLHKVGDGLRTTADAPLRWTIRRNVFGEMKNALAFASAPPAGSQTAIEDNTFALSTVPVLVQGAPPLVPSTNARMLWTDDGPNPYIDAPVGKRYFRKSFVLNAVPAKAVLDYMADNQCTVWINGQKLPVARHVLSNRRLTMADVTSVLRAGDNSIAVLAENTPNSTNVTTNSAWLLVRLSWQDAAGTTREMVSDGSWKGTKDVPLGEWTTEKFDDSKWPAAKVLSTPAGFRLPVNYVWESQVAKLGDLPTQVITKQSGNVRGSSKVAFSPYVQTSLSRADVATEPSDDATFLRPPAEPAKSKSKGKGKSGS